MTINKQEVAIIQSCCNKNGMHGVPEKLYKMFPRL